MVSFYHEPRTNLRIPVVFQQVSIGYDEFAGREMVKGAKRMPK